MRWPQKSPSVSARYSHCNNGCRVPVRCVSFGRSVNVSSNKVDNVNWPPQRDSKADVSSVSSSSKRIEELWVVCG